MHISGSVDKLTDILKIPGSVVLFAGVGNLLKRDDGAGVVVAMKIKPTKTIAKLTVEMGIENYIGKINRLAPDILVIIDAAFMGREPGFTGLFKAGDMMDMTTNTHNISLSKISELFEMPVYILGIQPADVSFGEGMSREVGEAVDRVTKLINNIYRN